MITIFVEWHVLPQMDPIDELAFPHPLRTTTRIAPTNSKFHHPNNVYFKHKYKIVLNIIKCFFFLETQQKPMIQTYVIVWHRVEKSIDQQCDRPHWTFSHRSNHPNQTHQIQLLSTMIHCVAMMPKPHRNFYKIFNFSIFIFFKTNLPS